MKRLISITIFSLSMFSSFSVSAGLKLRFIGDQNIATGDKFKETEIGGLSGITFDKKKNRFLAISDDKGQPNDVRFYEFDYKIDDHSISLTPAEVVFLKDAEGKNYRKGTMDCEDIVLLNDEVIISSEGAIRKEPPIPPGLFVYSRDGKFKRNLEVPDKFLPEIKHYGEKGIRDNLGFEAMTLTPDASSLWVGTEESLFQDDKSVSTPNYASVVRLIQYKDLRPVKEVAYKLEKVPAISIAGLTVGETGLSAMLALDDQSFLSLERSYLPLLQRTIVRIYKFTINDKTTDISKIDSIKKKKITMVDKELVADMDDFSKSMSDRFRTIDNLEGMAFGPKLPNGNSTLILISDNNFRKQQRTQVLAFEILPWP